jgi:hypothetical protein
VKNISCCGRCYLEDRHVSEEDQYQLQKDRHLDQQQNWHFSEHEAENCNVPCEVLQYTNRLLSIVISLTSFTCPNNSHVDTVKYLINKKYSIFILINIKNCTFLCLMLGHLFRR